VKTVFLFTSHCTGAQHSRKYKLSKKRLAKQGKQYFPLEEEINPSSGEKCREVDEI